MKTTLRNDLLLSLMEKLARKLVRHGDAHISRSDGAKRRLVIFSWLRGPCLCRSKIVRMKNARLLFLVARRIYRVARAWTKARLRISALISSSAGEARRRRRRREKEENNTFVKSEGRKKGWRLPCGLVNSAPLFWPFRRPLINHYLPCPVAVVPVTFMTSGETSSENIRGKTKRAGGEEEASRGLYTVFI